VRERDAFVVEFDHEMAATRRVLERVPEDAFGWTPHERSFSVGGLATHLAVLPHWGCQILAGDDYDLAGASNRAAPRGSRDEVLELFDRHVAELRRCVLDSSDAELAADWTLKRGGQIVLCMPRIAALRRFLLHHLIHHRGQMTVYLRLREVPVPPLYGPTADERL
jgi:uncharacterized damage-inducible protein DinB